MTDHASIAQFLEARGIHHDFVAWAKAYESRWHELWDACPRADWLLALSAELGAPRQALVAAATSCVRFALDLDDGELPLSPPRLRDALAALDHYVHARPGDAPLGDALAALAACSPEDPALDALCAAAACALNATSAPREAAGAAALAAQSVVFSVGDCAMMPALMHAQRTSADRVRAHIGVADLAIPDA